MKAKTLNSSLYAAIIEQTIWQVFGNFVQDLEMLCTHHVYLPTDGAALGCGAICADTSAAHRFLRRDRFDFASIVPPGPSGSIPTLVIADRISRSVSSTGRVDRHSTARSMPIVLPSCGSAVCATRPRTAA